MVEFNRFKIKNLNLKDRYSKVEIQKACVSGDEPLTLTSQERDYLEKVANEIIKAKESQSSVVCAFGAHAIKNGLGNLLGKFLTKGWFTHLCTNGAGIIHDWEFAYQGTSSEDVRANVVEGHFGTWQETGLYINLALVVGAYQGLGYGASVGSMISQDGLFLPTKKELIEVALSSVVPLWKRSAALDLLDEVEQCHLDSGFLKIQHPYKAYSIQKASFDCNRPFTSHPMIGHDIIYTHYANKGSAVGRTAERDFLSYANSVSNLEGGVYLSVGSAVMSPMIFEKSLSMSRNVLLQQEKDIRNADIHVVDIQEASWNWSKGEPPMENPAYYLRFMKTFNRMGLNVDYQCMDNRRFFLGLWKILKEKDS